MHQFGSTWRGVDADLPADSAVWRLVWPTSSSQLRHGPMQDSFALVDASVAWLQKQSQADAQLPRV